jgi:hypothetical protein
MEKLVIFLPIILFFGFFALLVIGFFVLIFKLIMKSKNSFWTGEVMDKVHNQRRDFDSDRMEDFYYLAVTTDQGKEMKVGLSAQMWDQFNKGDKIKKDKGKLYPEKI